MWQKIYSSVKCCFLTEKYEIWKYNWQFLDCQTTTHLTHQSSCQDLKQKKAKRASVVKRFLTPVHRSRSNTRKERLRTIFWSISHLSSWALNVISFRTCIAFLWDINCLLSLLFPALITACYRKQNFKNSCETNKPIRVRVIIREDKKMVWDGGEQNSETMSLHFDVIMAQCYFVETLASWNCIPFINWSGIRCTTITVPGVKEQRFTSYSHCVSIVGWPGALLIILTQGYRLMK